MTKLFFLIYNKQSSTGFSLIEALLSAALFSLITATLVGTIIYGKQTTMIAGQKARAADLAEEGLEATRNIRNANFTNLTDGNHGLAISANVWTFSGTQDVTDIFTRQIAISTVDVNRKQITSTVTWPQNLQRPGTISLVTYLTNWQKTIQNKKGGFLVYGDGGTTADTIMYKTFDANSGIWGAATAAADIDLATANKALRAARIFASATRNEKILVSRHFNSTTQFIYAQVFNGTGWGNVNLLSSWSANTFLDVQNFDGAYLSNGDFMVVYTDNTNIPKFKIWNGISWSASSISCQLIGAATARPNYIVLKNRPSSNEVMLAIYDQAKIITTQYFNGSSYVQDSWTLFTTHPSRSNLNSNRVVDFDWSPNNNTKGGLVYTSNSSNKRLSVNVFTANGSGGGGWATAAVSPTQPGAVGPVSIIGQPGADYFLACDKDSTTRNVQINCYRANYTPLLTATTNGRITTSADLRISRNYQPGFEPVSASLALIVFSELSGNYAPKFKTYNPTTNTWDLTSTAINTAPYSLGDVSSVRMISETDTDDIMVLLADSNLDLYSLVWDGANNAFYAAPAGDAFSQHGTNGSAVLDFWYDFAWSIF